MEKKMELYCLDCKKLYPFEFRLRCGECNGAIEIRYDLAHAKINDSSTNPIERYFDILPIPSLEFSHHMGEGNTPLVHAKELGLMIGLDNLFLKLEGANPTNTTKDRMASVSLSYLAATGIREFVTSSTGNSSTSYGVYISNFGDFKVHIFMGLEFIQNYRVNDNENINTFLVDGTFVEACQAARQYARLENKILEAGFFNIGRREGLKISVLEAYDQAGQSFDWLFQAVSSAMGILGSYKGIKEFMALGRADHMPKIVCCQQSSNPPMVSAFQAGSPVIREHDKVEHPMGIAHAILRGDPTNTYPYIYRLIRETKGHMEKAELEEILKAVEITKETEDLEIGYAAAVAMASLIKMAQKGTIGKDEKVLVNVTDGKDILPPTRTTWRLWKDGEKN